MHNKYHSHITTSFSEDEGAWYIKSRNAWSFRDFSVLLQTKEIVPIT